MRYIRHIKLSQVVKQGKARAVRLRKDTVKTLKRSRRSLKKTFSKKRNQRRLTYVFSALMIVSLLFGILTVKVQSQNEKQQLYNAIQKTEREKVEKLEELQTVSKALQRLEKRKAVTDTQLKRKQREGASMKLRIKKLKAELQARAEARARIKSRTRVRALANFASATPLRSSRLSSRTTFSRPLRSYSSDNTYTPGQCTWGVKEWRPDIPNGWGNAYEWWDSAGAMGWPRGLEPRVGAVAVTSNGGGHVGLVTAVHSNGTVTFKDMNGNYVPYSVGYRTIPKYSYKYIY